MNDLAPDKLVGNIINNFNYVKSDFLGITLFNRDIFLLILSMAFVIFLFLILYLIGDKFRLKFFKQIELDSAEFFVNIAIGYIVIGSGIAILGIFSLFYKWSLLTFFISVIFFSVFPLTSLKKRINKMGYVFQEYKKIFNEHPIINIAIFGFVLIGFLRLIPPEAGVDAIWYHTDYPALYLKTHSMMGFDPKGDFQFYPIVTPTLADMYFVITQFFGMKDASRMVHYMFYLSVVLLYIVGFNKKNYSSHLYACLLLVTSPVIIRHTSTAYGEFPWLLCWLLAILVLIGKSNSKYKKIILSAILFGGTLATKQWMLPFYWVFIVYISFKSRKFGISKTFKEIFLFTFFCLLVPVMWYVRSYIATGSPIFPTFRTDMPGLGIFSFPLTLFTLESLRHRILSLLSFSPLFVIALPFLFVRPSIKTKIKHKEFIIFVIILTAIHLLINYSYHRFIIPFYSVIVLVLGAGLLRMKSRYPIFRPVFFIGFTILFIYYFLNTLLVLPYGFGWADANKYLTRVLSRDNSSYYDYDYRFSQSISKNDLVATYGLWGFYYADFNYMYAKSVLNKGSSLDILVRKGATKLLIKGGDINWLCKTEQLIECNQKKYDLLTSYVFPHLPASQYLYALIK